jgi:citrate lyase beta subunit
MRHFEYLSEPDRRRLFHRDPQAVDVAGAPLQLAIGLGATLYCPATRPALAEDLVRRAAAGVISTVVCLEDSVADHDLVAAERNAVDQLRRLAGSGARRPLVFLRVRRPDQIEGLMRELGPAVDVLAGFVLPKFGLENAEAYLDAVCAAGSRSGRRLLAMPVLETPEIIHAETRLDTLLGIRKILEAYRDIVLAVRLGATDFSAAYGLRRSREMTVYDIRVVADAISAVVNVFARADGGFAVTGPVWEYFSSTERLFKTQLRESPFVEHAEQALRGELIARDLDGLIREVALDKANGLVGKTVIHPHHVAAVHALSVVTHEEYCDAVDLIGTGASGGVAASAYRNKMNESKPHAAWARRIMDRADVFGVARESTSFVDLLGAGLRP